MNSNEIKKQVSAFQKIVQELGTEINNAGALWNDSKFQELSTSIGEIASNSRDVIMSGESYSALLMRFEQIASEKY